MADIIIHHASVRIIKEMPWNGLCIEVAFTTEDSLDTLTLYFGHDDVEGWWQFRQCAPKADDYRLSPAQGDASIEDHKIADIIAARWYAELTETAA